MGEERLRAGNRRIGRRDLVAVIGGAALGWPLVTQAQQPTMPVVGFLSANTRVSNAVYAAGLRRGLDETGFAEGRNVAIEYRWAEGHFDRLPALAGDLVQRRVAAIVTAGGLVSALAAKAATATIPIVFSVGDDPVKAGLVQSLNRPGGNLTGFNPMIVPLDPKRLALLHELVPGASVVAALLNPRDPDAELQRAYVEASARTLGLKLFAIGAGDAAEFEPAFEKFAQQRAGMLLVTGDPFFSLNRNRLAALATKYALPAIYPMREDAAAGGLMSYGTDQAEVFHQAGIYAGRILKGEKPGELPVVRPTKFELVINLKTAKALGLAIPPNLLARADEVIE